jgi:hypothetical protein
VNQPQKVNLHIFAGLAFVLATVLIISPAAPCQVAPAHSQDGQAGDSEFGIWASYAPQAPHVIGVTSPRQFGVLGFRYGHLIFEKPGVSLEYTLDVLPVAIMLQPKILGAVINPHGHTTYLTGSREAVYGGGVNPLGLKLNLFRAHKFQLFGASTAGFISSVRRIPVDFQGETQFNFDFDFQLGFQLYNSRRTRSWMFGYKYQHISNAYRGEINPGVDLNTVFVGYSFFK